MVMLRLNRVDLWCSYKGNYKMNGKAVTWVGCLCVALSLLGASRADESDKRVERPASAAAETAESPKKADPAETARQSCIQQCNLANGHCNSEVRQARQECSRNAANSGRDPMTMRNDEYSYFCSYFHDPGYQGPGNFRARFTQHYSSCINLMQRNIASMRHDCYLNERDAQNICRGELRECQAACQ